MIRDEFAEEIFDKMNNGVSRLPPISRRLYSSLNSEFLSRGRKNTIKTPLFSYAKYLGISSKEISVLSQQIKNAFDEIHANTFVRYEYEIVTSSRAEEPELFISAVDNSEEITAILERVYKGKSNLS